jgi:hypothetical protein
MWYNINFDKLAILLLPTFLRKPTMVAYVQALLQPIDDLHFEWLQKRDLIDFYKLQYTGQVCRLRKVLNDQLDSDERRITIANGNAFKRSHIFTDAENKPKFLGTFFIRSKSEYENTGVDFVVFVPQTIINKEPFKLDFIIKFYKLAGKRYKIESLP